jgi:hypothetical protein
MAGYRYLRRVVHANHILCERAERSVVAEPAQPRWLPGDWTAVRGAVRLVQPLALGSFYDTITVSK